MKFNSSVFDNEGVKWVVVAAEVEVVCIESKKKFFVEWKMCYRLRSSTLTDPSLAEAPTLSPRLFQQISKMPPEPRYEWTSSPDKVDQMWIHRSNEPEAINLPSGENDTLYTGSSCFVSEWRHVPRSTSHNLFEEFFWERFRGKFELENFKVRCVLFWKTDRSDVHENGTEPSFRINLEVPQFRFEVFDFGLRYTHFTSFKKFLL